jgi:hypothetical protein
MDADDHVKLLDRAFNFQLALVSHGNLGSDNFRKTQKEAKEIFQDIEGAAKPWLGRGSREDRANDERDTFAEQWEEIAGFSLTDKDAMAKWEDDLTKHTSDSVKGLHERQAAEAKFTDSFAERLAAIQQKRMKQQGR